MNVYSKFQKVWEKLILFTLEIICLQIINLKRSKEICENFGIMLVLMALSIIHFKRSLCIFNCHIIMQNWIWISINMTSEVYCHFLTRGIKTVCPNICLFMPHQNNYIIFCFFVLTLSCPWYLNNEDVLLISEGAEVPSLMFT